MSEQVVCNRPLQILASINLLMYKSSLVLLVGHGRKWRCSSFKGICRPKANIEESV